MATQSKQKTVNVASKGRQLSRGDKPYASWTDTRTGWQYKLLRSYQANNGKAYSRWFMWVKGFDTDLGDTYVEDLWWGVKNANDLEFDTAIWPTQGEFLRWAMGTLE